jgi:two-component system, NarL family, invasion response regulator UvrY
MLRILIADDHAIVREGLKHILSDKPDLQVVGEAGNAEELRDLLRGTPCDVVVLDISMPGRSGLEALEEVKREHPTVPVLVLSMHPEQQYAVRALKLGAAGYLTKENYPAELVKAIRKVVARGRYISPSLAEKLAFARRGNRGLQLHENLSPREDQVLRMMASGKAMKDIAAELALSIKTVSMFRRRILLKMGMQNNMQLIRYALEHNLVD